MVGLFSDFSGNISFDANNVPASKLNVTIKTDSLRTQFVLRDKDLKGADWFNVTEFPEMTFVGSGKERRSHRYSHGKAHAAWRDQTGYAQRCREQSRSEPARQDSLRWFFRPRYFQAVRFRYEDVSGRNRR